MKKQSALASTANSDNYVVPFRKNLPALMQNLLPVILLLLSCEAFSQEVIRKEQNKTGAYTPLGGQGGSSVFANSFVAEFGGVPETLGTWMSAPSGGGGYRLEIWGGGPSGPDPSNVIATTGSLPQVSGGSLRFVSSPVLPGAGSVSPGSRYWFIVTVVGEEPGKATYSVGWHERNSLYLDNGDFAISGDAEGLTFDILGDPEIAFEIVFSPSLPAMPTESLSVSGRLRFPVRRVGRVARRTLVATNSGASEISLGGLRISGRAARDFSFARPVPSDLSPGQSTSLRVTFRPRRRGVRRAVATVSGVAIAEEVFTGAVEELIVEEPSVVTTPVSASSGLVGRGAPRRIASRRIPSDAPNSPRFP